MEKLAVATPIIVEGKYDKIALNAVLDAHILTTDGFGLFNNREKAKLLARLAEKNGVIVLTDPDGGGRQIRSFLSGILPKEKVIHLYIPRKEGKERRKTKPGAAGILGVEGMDAALLRRLFEPFAGAAQPKKGGLNKSDLYLFGFSGREDSAQKRKDLCLSLSLPPDMTANALLEALNLLYTKEEALALLQTV